MPVPKYFLFFKHLHYIVDFVCLEELYVCFNFWFWCRMVLKGDASLDGISNLIKSHIPDAKKARLHGREISYILPREYVSQ